MGQVLLALIFAKALIKEKYKVIVIDNLFRGKLENLKSIKDEIEFFKLDMTSDDFREEFTKILLEKKPSYIFHYAAINGTEYFYDKSAEVSFVNSYATLNLMEGIKKAKLVFNGLNPKVIFASTSEVYGEPFEIPTKESSTTHVRIDQDRDSYAAAKLMSEFYVKLYSQDLNIDYLICRIFNVYGPGMIGTKYGQVIPEFINRLQHGEYPLKILGTGEHTRSFCYIDDHVALTMKLFQSNDYNTVVNLGNPYEISIKQLANKIMSIMGLEPKLEFKKEREGDHLRRNPCLTKLKGIIGNYNFLSLEEGIIKSL